MPLNLTTKDLLLMVGLPAISDFAGSMIASNASRRAADTQVAATERAAELNRQTSREALDLQRQIYNDQIRRAEPYRQGGLGAFNKLLQWSGLPSPAASPATGEIPAPTSRGSSAGLGWTPPPTQTRTGSQLLPAAINTAGTLGSLALLGGGSGAAGAAGGGTIGILHPVTGALVTGGKAGAAAAGGAMKTLGALATNPITIGAAAAGLGVMGWLKSQAHWEANDAVKNFENPFHYEFLAPLSQALDSGRIQPEEAVQLLDENWDLYQQRIRQWAGDSSDRKKVAQQSVTNPKFTGTIQGIRDKAVSMQSSAQQPATPGSVPGSGGQPSTSPPMGMGREQLMALADRYRRTN